LDGVKFRRQHPIEPYVVDFESYAPRLIVEVDGSQHATNMAHDNQREAYLRGERFEGLRLWNPQVLTQIDAVLEAIRLQVDERSRPSP
jgi:very-short-patch-repair endonuclease